MRERIELSDEWRYAQLATLIESWGYRASLERERVMDRPELALRWFREEYEPMVDMLREAGIGGGGTETERYLRVSMLRFLLLQRHDWSEEIAEKPGGRGQVTEPGRGGGHDDPPDHQGDAGLASSARRRSSSASWVNGLSMMSRPPRSSIARYGLRVAGHEQHADAGAQRRHAFGDLLAQHLRHDHVGQQHVDRARVAFGDARARAEPRLAVSTA